MELIEIGFFRELSYGNENGPSIKDYMIDCNREDEESIIKYINGGKVFLASPGIVYDILDKSKMIGGGPYILTDGVFTWLNELSYYVEHYHIRLPEEFILHMKANNWKVPANINLSELIFPRFR